jgi:putative ABC transport system permease protein
MSMVTLSFTLAFVLLAILLSIWLRLGLERDMIVATVRSTIQLIAVGYVLKVVFALQDAIYIVIMVVLMVVVASQNAQKRGKEISGIFLRIVAAISLTEIITQGLLLGLHVVPLTPRYVIPISGMIIGNAMVASGLFLNRMQSETKSHKQEILTVLSLGGSAKQSIMPYVKQSIRAGMLPTIDSAKTMGLVQLPGMMTGQIIAGANPVQAVRYQLLIVFSIIASAAITSIALGFLTFPKLFNEYGQLK